MTVVVVTPRGQMAEALVTQLLPSDIVIRTATCFYSFFDVLDGDTDQFAFADVDGEVLTEYRTFPTLEAARTWVADDADQRGAGHGR